MNKQWLAVLALAVGCADNNGGVTEYFGEDPNSFDDKGEPQAPRDREDEEQGPAVCGAAEVHVIGIYETSEGSGVVRIERPGLHSLVLSSYEPTRWRVELGAGARIHAIHLVGYHSQTVMPPHEDITITTDTYEQTDGGACGYSWPYNGEGCDTNALLAIAKKRTDADVTSFHGCYQASKFTIGRDLTATANCTSSAMSKFHGSCKAPSPAYSR